MKCSLRHQKAIAGRWTRRTSSDVPASTEFTGAEVTAGVVVTATLYLLVEPLSPPPTPPLLSTNAPFATALHFHRNSSPHCCSNVLNVLLYLTFAIFLNSQKIIIPMVLTGLLCRLQIGILLFSSLFLFHPINRNSTEN